MMAGAHPGGLSGVKHDGSETTFRVVVLCLVVLAHLAILTIHVDDLKPLQLRQAPSTAALVTILKPLEPYPRSVVPEPPAAHVDLVGFPQVAIAMPVIQIRPPDPAPGRPAAAAFRPVAPVQTAPQPSSPVLEPIRKTCPQCILDWEARLYRRIWNAMRDANLRKPGDGWEGRVVLRVLVAADGTVLSERIDESSGDGTIDRAAIQAINRASPLPSPPTEFGEPPFTLQVPLHYRFHDVR